MPDGSRPCSDAAFRSATPWCDADHPAIVRLARRLARDTEAGTAAAIFAYVRDSITYTMGEWNFRASETLARGEGTCSNKAALYVALARACGLAAGFHVQYIQTWGYFAGGFIPTVRRMARDVAIHVYVAVEVDGRWVKVDPTDDRALSDSIEGFVPHAKAQAFDGTNDVTLPFDPLSIVSDRGVLPDIDASLSRPASIPPLFASIFGLLVRFVRDHGSRFGMGEEERIDREFQEWLAVVAPGTFHALHAHEGARMAA